MKNILPILIALIMSGCAFAEDAELQEVILDGIVEGVEITEPAGTLHDIIDEDEAGKTLKKKMCDIYNLEVCHIDRPSYLMGNILTKKYSENSPIKSTHIWGAYNGYADYSFNEGSDNTSTYSFNAINLGLDGRLKNNVADFRIMTGIVPKSHRNMVQNLFSDVYIATNKIPHHRLQFGHFRPRVGMEGGNSSYTLPFLYRSQIARNYGTARRVGARAIGEYSLIDYDFGGYNSATYFEEFFPGGEFIGWVNFKPLGLTDGRYGQLKLGGGIDKGHRDSDFCVTGAYAGYEYKKFMANFEWANADGYNGGSSGKQTHNHSSGFYATIGYMLTPKLQLLARYDQFDPNKNVKRNNKREYSVGLNYFINGQALRFMINYIFCQNDSQKDSHRIMIGTQILL